MLVFAGPQAGVDKSSSAASTYQVRGESWYATRRPDLTLFREAGTSVHDLQEFPAARDSVRERAVCRTSPKGHCPIDTIPPT